MALAGPLAQGEAVGRQLAEGEIAPLRHPLQTVVLEDVGQVGEGHGAAFDLGLTYGGGRVGACPQPRQRPHRLAPHPLALSGETDVAVIAFVGHRRVGDDAHPPDEVGLRVAVEDEAVDDPHAVGPGVEVQPHRDRQPLARSIGVNAVQLDHRAYGAGLLDHSLTDADAVARGLHRPALFQFGLVLRQGDQGQLAHDRTAAARRAGNQGVARLRHAPFQIADRDDDLLAPIGDPHRLAGRRRDAGGQRQTVQRSIPGHRMGRPFQRTIRPIGDRPGLGGGCAARSVADTERLIGAKGAARPRHAEGRALKPGRLMAIQPAKRRGGRAAARCGQGDAGYGLSGGERDGAHQQVTPRRLERHVRLPPPQRRFTH